MRKGRIPDNMVVVCSACGKELEPAPARFDGEDTYVGYYPCPKHPKASPWTREIKEDG